jgi:small subunit ribosomal protein S12
MRGGRPQRGGIIIRVYTRTPKKPNSAIRKVARVRIKGGRGYEEVEAYITGERGRGGKIEKGGRVLIIPKATKDVPGVRYRII